MSGEIEKMMETISRLNDRNEIMQCIHSLENKMEEKSMENNRNNSGGIGLTLKQKILLLWALKILDTPSIKSLPAVKKASLLSTLLGHSEKSVKDLLTYINRKEPPIEFFIFKEDNINRVNEVLKGLGLQEYFIKEEKL